MGTLESRNRGVMSRKDVQLGVLCVFFVSGMSGLIYEVTWTRMLRLVMGNTTFSITTVLCAFMAGLALGSYIAGRMIDRRNDPLRIFAILEGTIGLYCLCLPVLIELTGPVYRWLYQNTETTFYGLSMVRFLFCGTLLLIPATFMGATLPVLTRFFASTGSVGWSVARLYAINTFGAVLGTFGSGFILIPSLGVSKTIYLAVALNLLVCTTAYYLYRRTKAFAGQEAADQSTLKPTHTGHASPKSVRPQTKAASAVEYGRWAMTAVLVGYGISGAAAMVYEIAWTRALSLMFGSSAYAFSLMLIAFILGLAAGSMIFSRYVDRVRDPMLALALLELGIGVTALAVAPVFNELPFFVTSLIWKAGDSFWALQLYEFALSVAIMLLPTLLMGAAFPLASRLVAQGPASAGRSVGAVYAWNTMGAIVGSFLGGFVLIPTIGIRYAIFVAVATNVLLGCALSAFAKGPKARWRAAISAIVLGACGAGMAMSPPWDPGRMSFGPFMYSQRSKESTALTRAAMEQMVQGTRILYYKEGLATTITVTEMPDGNRALLVNGKPDASAFGDLPTQTLLAHVPLLMHPNPKSVLVIGLASGITLGSAGLHPVESLDCAEIAPEMVEACHFFDAYNHDILADPRVKVLAVDGRNHLALTTKNYDVIISEPSNPWIAGVADLFTKEFFELCRDRLNDQGVVCVWLENYHIDHETYRSVISTFQSVFPNATVWNARGMDYLLIGVKGENRVDIENLERRIREPAILESLSKINIRSPEQFLGRLFLGSQAASRFAQGATLHTDDNAMLEFAAARIVSVSSVDPELSRLAAEGPSDADMSFIVYSKTDSAKLTQVKARVRDFVRSEGYASLGFMYDEQRRTDAMWSAFKTAVELNPDNSMIREYVKTKMEGVNEAMRGGDSRLALLWTQHLAEITPDNADLRWKNAVLMEQAGRFDDAIAEYRQALKLNPDRPSGQERLAKLAAARGQWPLAIERYGEALRRRGDSASTLNDLAWLLATCPQANLRNAPEAVRLAEKAASLVNQSDANVLDTLAVAYAAAGRFADARAVAEKAIAVAEKNPALAKEIQSRLELYRNNRPYVPSGN